MLLVYYLYCLKTCVCVFRTTVDDEEEMLYGDSNPLTSPGKDEFSRSAAPSQSERTGAQSRHDPTHWCMVVRESGVMEVTEVYIFCHMF